MGTNHLFLFLFSYTVHAFRSYFFTLICCSKDHLRVKIIVGSVSSLVSHTIQLQLTHAHSTRGASENRKNRSNPLKPLLVWVEDSLVWRVRFPNEENWKFTVVLGSFDDRLNILVPTYDIYIVKTRSLLRSWTMIVTAVICLVVFSCDLPYLLFLKFWILWTRYYLFSYLF